MADFQFKIDFSELFEKFDNFNIFKRWFRKRGLRKLLSDTVGALRKRFIEHNFRGRPGLDSLTGGMEVSVSATVSNQQIVITSGHRGWNLQIFGGWIFPKKHRYLAVPVPSLPYYIAVAAYGKPISRNALYRVGGGLYAKQTNRRVFNLLRAVYVPGRIRFDTPVSEWVKKDFGPAFEKLYGHRVWERPAE